MAAASPRATHTGSGLLRLLSDLDVAGGPVPDADPGRSARPSFAERLGLWLDWTDAIALSAALNTPAAARTPADGADAPQRRVVPRVASTAAAASSAAALCQRVRSDLVKLATADVGYSAGAAAERTADFSPHRRDYLAHQRAMESAIAPLRAQVRATLSGLTPAGARLAALDAVMDEALRPREKHLLATLPVWLERHFERLQRAQAAAGEGGDVGDAGDAGDGAAGHTPAADAPALHHRYHRDMQRVLLAELDLRLAPVEGMMEALRHETHPTP